MLHLPRLAVLQTQNRPYLPPAEQRKHQDLFQLSSHGHCGVPGGACHLHICAGSAAQQVAPRDSQLEGAGHHLVGTIARLPLLVHSPTPFHCRCAIELSCSAACHSRPWSCPVNDALHTTTAVTLQQAAPESSAWWHHHVHCRWLASTWGSMFAVLVYTSKHCCLTA